MALIQSLFLNFCSAMSWIMLVHYIDRIVEKHTNEFRRARKKVVYRIVSAVVITIVNHGMYFLAMVTLRKPIGLGSYYRLDLGTFWKIVKVLLVNSVLFFGNWMVQHSQNYQPLKDTLSKPNRDLNLYKRILIAPFLEEMLFTVLSHWTFTIFQLNSNRSTSPTLYVIANSLVFSLAHLHMKWEDISIIWSYKSYKSGGIISKLIQSARISLGLLIITFVYKTYTNIVITRVVNFWPCFILHAYCNLMGGPSLNYQSPGTRLKLEILESGNGEVSDSEVERVREDVLKD